MKKNLTFTVVIILFSLVFIAPLFIKVTADCKSQYGDCPQEILNKISSVNGKRIYSAKKELKKILSSDFLVSTYSLRFKLPNNIHIDLLVKKPLFTLQNQSSDFFVLIDKDGQVLGSTKDSSLPNLIVNGNLPETGQKIKDEDLFALNLIDGVYQMYQVNSGKIDGDALLVDLSGPVRVIFPLVGADKDVLLGSLRLVYSNIQGAEGNSLYKEIDMRYKNPVLR